MYRKLSLIFLLAMALAVFLYFQPWKAFQTQPPRFYDRLPNADIIGKSQVLELSRSLSATLYHYKIPLREFFSQEFILGQGKSFGLDLQSPVFFFMNQTDFQIDDYGALIMVSDSSRIMLGIDKLKKLMPLRDTVLYEQVVYFIPKEKTYMTYGKDWMLVYSGDNFLNTLRNVKYAKFNEIPPKWRTFLNNTQTGANLYAHISFEGLREEGINSVDMHLSNDTTNLLLHTKISYTDSILVRLKKEGPAYVDHQFTKNNISLHLDVEKMRQRPDNPMNSLINRAGKRIGFPTKDFMKAWKGDLAFRQGGIETIKENYVVSELDEDFNITEVTKVKDVKIQGFSFYMSLNNHGKSFVNKLFSKGILTSEGNKYRFLYSPPLHLKLNDSSLVLHTSTYAPKMHSDSSQFLKYTYQNTAYELYLDSTDAFQLYGRIRIPLDNIVKTTIPASN